MAGPRVFISSTYYDLKDFRADLDVLSDDMKFDVVRFENGDIPYHVAATLPEACCKAIDHCHVLVSIIGGRRGSVVAAPRRHGPYPPGAAAANGQALDDADKATGDVERRISITRLEVERAVNSGLAIFCFVEANVHAEFNLYRVNKDQAEVIRWTSVDDVAVFEFIDYVYDLKGSTPVFTFNTARDAIRILKLQFAGLVRDLLERQKLQTYGAHLDQLVQSFEKVRQLQNELDREKNLLSQTRQEMLVPSHPIFASLQSAIDAECRIFFTSIEELELVMTHFGCEPVDEREVADKTRMFFIRRDADAAQRVIGIERELFNQQGLLVPHEASVWSDRSVFVGKDTLAPEEKSRLAKPSRAPVVSRKE
jgi:hypothetical protein